MEGKSLNALIDFTKVECLNEDPHHGLVSLLKPLSSTDGTAYVSSVEEDCELLLKLGFLQPVKLSGLRITARDGKAGNAPKNIKLFVNCPTMGIDDASTDCPVQELELSRDAVERKEVVVPLRFVKFQNVSSIAVFVETNQDDESETQLSDIEFFGLTGDNMDIKAWKILKEDEKLMKDD